MRHRIVAAALIAAALAAPGALHADQTDPRLEQLFARLSEVDSRAEAQHLERRIWRIWHAHEDEKVQSVMSRGQFYLRRGNREQALAAFDQAVRIAPNFAEAWNARATLHFMVGNYRRSLGDIRRALHLEPRHFGALAGKGLCHMALGEPREAMAAFERSLAIHPKQPGTEARLERLRKELQERDI